VTVLGLATATIAQIPRRIQGNYAAARCGVVPETRSIPAITRYDQGDTRNEVFD
jgi:hypothetical protein